jgi:hypothetical protein
MRTVLQDVIQWTIENAFNIEGQDGTKYIAIDYEEMRERFDEWLEKERKQFVNENKTVENKNMINNINNVGKKLSKDYIVTINYSLPYISLTNNPSKEELEKPNQTFVPQKKREFYTKDEHILQSSIWFSQGEEAQNLIDEIPDNIKPEYYILWYLESAGVF